MSVGLVLEGGGMRGAFTAGALSAFSREEITFSSVTGVSAGALTATSFLAGQPRRNYEIFVEYAADPRYMGVEMFRKTGSFFNFDFMLRELSEELLPMDFAAIYDNPADLCIGMTEVETGRAEYFNKNSMPLEDLLTVMQGSASLPIISKIVEFREKKYLDGGIAAPIPIQQSIDAGNEYNVIVLTRPESYVKRQERRNPVLTRMYRDYPAFLEVIDNRHEVYAAQQELCRRLEREGRAVVICPRDDIRMGRYERSPERLAALFDSALFSAFEKLPAIAEMIERDKNQAAAGRTKISGKVHKYGDNVDTDVIIPARYLNTSSPSELAAHCMEDIDPGFAGRVRAGDVIVGGSNFGCGSSREHAPIAIKAAGVGLVVGVSFARIFYRNAINIGLPILECPGCALEAEAGDVIEADLAAGLLKNITKDKTYLAEPFPPFVREIIEVGGLLRKLKKKFEKGKRLG